MNRAPQFAALAMALLVLGCGGSSSTTTTQAVSLPTNLTTPQVEAIITPSSVTSTDPNAVVVQDAQNIEVGQNLTFQLAAYGPTGTRYVLSPDRWFSDDNGIYGNLATLSGNYQVSTQLSQTAYQVGSTYSTITYSTNVQVKPREARLIGRILSSTGTPIRNIGIMFYDSLGLAGEVFSSYDGTFRASVDTGVTTFTIDPATVSASYWLSYTYNDSIYDAAVDTCKAPLGTLYNSTGSALGVSLSVGDNYMFAPAQPAALLTPVRPASANDAGVIVLAAKATYTTKPSSTGCQ